MSDSGVHHEIDARSELGARVRRYSAASVCIGRFECRPSALAWTRTNVIGQWALVVVPHRGVEILQEGRDPILASRGRSVFYNAGQAYERRLVDPRGDECTYFALRPDLLADIVAAQLETDRCDPSAPFEMTGGPLGPAAYRRYLSLLWRLDHEPDPGGLLEEAMDLVALVVESARMAQRSSRVRTTAATLARRRALAHEVERVLTQTFDQSLDLDTIAQRVGASPYHVARQFRAHTGSTIHGYRMTLRLNSALERLRDPRTTLTDLALELGFSSHSHFSQQFRRHLGLTPSKWRALSVRARPRAGF